MGAFLLFAWVYLLVASPMLFVLSLVMLYREFKGYAPLPIWKWSTIYTLLFSPFVLTSGHAGVILPSFVAVLIWLRALVRPSAYTSAVKGMIWPFFPIGCVCVFALSALLVAIFRKSSSRRIKTTGDIPRAEGGGE